ncbi:HlyD family type I secretion periplasmic adaptor subunit [Pseudothioclava arenosa]|uniref:Membrane fusion protein (MFP) family protein n=1 Tax=Pseudothioclava arenosa TaxID=1795308 RepID=A0A2A4CQC8_9RHOB|nr:HlyD family type I secretion periplasmic adaptor subunit [Pseudothioclava arenosa]PCD76294.1 RTX toxin [Pseudothioclava arenosa]
MTGPSSPKRQASPSARGAVTLGLAAIAVLIFGFGLWAAFSSISGAVVASGQVEVEQNRQIVQHPDGGVIAEILVKDGDLVEAGDLLLRLDGTLLRSELTIVESQFFELLARRGRLEAERDDAEETRFPAELAETAASDPAIAQLMEGQRNLFAARRETMQKSLDQLAERRLQTERQIEGIGAQLAALSTQVDLIRRELADQRKLFERGLAQAGRVLALEREEAALAGQIGELTAARAQSEARLTEIAIEALRLASQRREEAETELRNTGYRELELAERRRALSEQIDRLDIRAPVSGLVHAMAVTTPRSVIRAADPVLYLIPQDRPLVISARIPPIHIDEVAIGLPVTLRFSAFSARTTPELFGQVSRISADALLDEATRAAYFRAEVVLKAGETDKLAPLQLVPGMPAEVYIRTAERSPLSYLLKPFTDYFNRAFREN